MGNKESKTFDEKKISEKKPKGNILNLNLIYFLSKIELLKNSSNYKKKGPYIYCALQGHWLLKAFLFFQHSICIMLGYLSVQKNY